MVYLCNYVHDVVMYLPYNNNNFISSILLIVVLHVYNGNKRHIKRETHTQYYIWSIQ